MFNKIKSYLKGGDSIQWVFGRSPKSSDYGWTKQKGMGYYEASLYLNRAINKRSDKVGEVEFKMMKGEKEIKNEWTELLRRPNKNQTGDQFWKLYQKYKDIYGEAYILKVKEEGVFNKNKPPTELRLLKPDFIEKNFNSDETEILSFTYSPKTGTKTTYTPDEIIYSYNPDPNHSLHGESLVRSGLRSLEVEIQANEYQAKSIKSGGNIDTVIKVKDAKSPEQLKELRENYRKLQGELWSEGFANEPMFAGGDMEVLRLALKPAEVGYLESKKMTIDDIVALTNVPKSLLGLTSGETFANSDASIRVFLRETIKPLVMELADVLNWRLIPDEFELVVVDPTPEDKEELRKDLETASNINALTTNEKRERMGLEPIPNGDEILVPFNLTTLNQPAPQQNSIKKKAHPLKNEIKRREFGEMYIKKLERRKEAVNRAVQKFFEDQEKRITGYLAKAYKSKSLVDDAFNMKTEIKLAENALLPVITELFMEQAEEHLTFLEGSKRKNFNFTSAMQIALAQRAGLFAQSINQATFNQLQNVFTNWASSDQTRDELINGIRETYGDISVGRAEVIARTETHWALQNANLEAIKQSGIDLKIWVWAPGVKGGVREEHFALDGTELPANGEFKIEKEDGTVAFFHAPGLTDLPGDAINCQCTLA